MGKFIYEGNVKSEIEDRALTHLQLVATVMELTSWLVLAPNLTHMRVTDHDQYDARQVVRSTLMHAARRVLGVPLEFKLPRAYAPEAVYVLMDGGLGLGPVLRCYEPRVMRAESDWAEVMKREWQERVGGGLECWAAVSEHRA